MLNNRLTDILHSIYRPSANIKNKLVSLFHFESIRSKILALSILLIVVPLVIVGAISSSITTHILKDSISETNLKTAKQARENLDFLMDEMEKALNKVVLDEKIQEMIINIGNRDDSLTYYKNKENIEREFRIFLSSKPEISYINFSTRKVEIIQGIYNSDYLDKTNLYNAGSGDFYKTLRKSNKTEFWLSSLDFIKDDSLSNCIYYVKIVDNLKNSNELGLLVVGIDKDAIIADLQEGKAYGLSNFLSVVDGDETVLVLSEPSKLFDKVPQAFISELHKRSGESFESSIDKSRYLVSYDLSDYSKWGVLSMIPMERAVEKVKTIRLITVAVIIICISITLVLVSLLSSKITMPLKNLTKLTTRIKENGLYTDIEENLHKKTSRAGKFIDTLLGLGGAFKKKLFRYFLIINIIPLIILIIILQNASYRIIEYEVADSIMEHLDYISKKLELKMKSAEYNSRLLFTNPVVQATMLQKTPLSPEKSLEITRSLDKVILKELSKEDGLVYVGLFSLLGENIYSSTNVYYDKDNILGEEWYKKLNGTNGENIWMDTYRDNLNNYVISAARKVSCVLGDTASVGKHVGYMLNSYDEDFLKDAYLSTGVDGQNDFFIVNRDNVVISNKSKELLGTKLDNDIIEKINGGKGSFISTMQGEKYLILYRSFMNYNWRLISMVSFNELAERNRSIFLYNLYILLSSFFIVTILSFRLSSKLSVSLVKVRNMMVKVEGGNLEIEDIIIKSKDEVEELRSSFVSMVNRLRDLIRQVYEIQISKQKAEIKQKEAEMSALQSQINPHFLYNTLETINWIAIDLLGNENEISKTVTALSNLFRSCINKDNMVVTLKKQFEDVEGYLFIQKLRYGDKLSVEWEIDPSIYEYKILGLIIQPLVENSLNHGFENIDGEMHIRIWGGIEQDKIFIQIKDNGHGITEDKLDEIRYNMNNDNDKLSSTSIGLINTNQRIKYYYGKEFGISIDSVHEQGTSVTIALPALVEQN